MGDVHTVCMGSEKSKDGILKVKESAGKNYTALTACVIDSANQEGQRG